MLRWSRTLPRDRARARAAIERIARVRHTSGSTRLWLSVSSQRSTLDKRKHSPEIPESTSSKAPSSGAMSPLRARHTTSPLVRSAIAVPFAPVRFAPCVVSGEWPPVVKALPKTVSRAVALECSFSSGRAEVCDANARRPWRSGSGQVEPATGESHSIVRNSGSWSKTGNGQMWPKSE
jgi:hypothetical protein